MQSNTHTPAGAVLAEAASRSGLAEAEMSRIAEALRDVLVSAALAGESVAVPRFGTFAPVKEDERVSRDLSTGRNVLLPPHLELRFTPAAALRHSATDR